MRGAYRFRSGRIEPRSNLQVRKLVKKFLNLVFYIASAWSLFIVSLVVLNVEWALPRAAGGQFEAFPLWLRLLYVVNVALLSLQVFAYAKQRLRMLQFFFWLSLASAAVNLISRSPLERWNALPAAISAYSIFVLMRDLRKV